MEGTDQMSSINQLAGTATAPYKPRFGGVLRRTVRVSNRLMVGAAGKRWNPVFAIADHVGRSSGRRYATPITARRVAHGFVVSLAFGPQVDWFRNLVEAGGGTIRWQGRAYAVGAPMSVDLATGIAAFNAVQRFFLRVAGIDNYVRMPDAVQEGA